MKNHLQFYRVLLKCFLDPDSIYFFLVEGGVMLLCSLGSPISSSSVTHCDSAKTKISPFL